jgi:hypothetical protein
LFLFGQRYIFLTEASIVSDFFQYCTQRLAVWLVADFEALSYQVTTIFDTG